MKHIKLRKVKRLSSWRKVSMATWKKPVDPSTYGLLKFDASSFAAFARESKLSTTQLFTSVMAHAIAENPQVNRMIRGVNLYQREDIDIFLQVSVDELGEDLSGTVIRHADKKNFAQIKEELLAAAKSIRNDEDESFRKVKRRVSMMPHIFTRPILSLLDFILYRLNFYSPFFGVRDDPFGSCMITSAVNFGAEFAFAPIPTISHVSLVISLFKIKDEAVVENGEIRIRPTLTVGATLDHRIIDGVYASKLIESMKKYIESPELLSKYQ